MSPGLGTTGVIYKHIHQAAYGLNTHVKSLAIDGTVFRG